MQSANRDVLDTLLQFGAAKNQIRLFHDGHELNGFVYKDIKEIDGVPLSSVVESRGKPLLYVVRDDSLTHSPENINDLAKRLASRGEYAYLAVLKPGKLTLFPCVLEEPQSFGKVFSTDKHSSLIRGLSEGVAPKSLAGAHRQLRDYNLRKQMLSAFMYAADSLRALNGLKPVKDGDEERKRTNIILSILGRVMFMRYLCDRNLIPADVVRGCSDRFEVKDIFTSPEEAARLFYWLDETFNGDLLPLISDDFDSGRHGVDYTDFLSKFPKETCRVMNRFFNGEDSPQLSLIKQLHFQYVPASLLSEVYQSFAHTYYADEAKDTSVHYTPQHIASVLVDQSFGAFEVGRVASLKVFDPSAGAGVFLVLCLRKMVMAHVSQGGVVNEHLIRSILYDQLRGADINPHALRLGTLALYLTAIELDPEPQPVEKQHFEKPLLGSVLHNVADDVGLGALAEKVDTKELGGPFDLVIGNPPWTKISGKENEALQIALRNVATKSVQNVWPDYKAYLKRKQLNDSVFSPDYSPVFPFLWRSLEWAKKNAVIAMALPAELLLFRETQSREALCRRLRITGIVNGADLNSSKFWEDVNEPFCLLFARNSVPDLNDSFCYVSPYLEKGLVDSHQLRLDSNQAQPVMFSQLEQAPHLLKTLFRGTSLDVSVLNQFLKVNSTLDEVCGASGVVKCNGYKKGKQSSLSDEQKVKRLAGYVKIRELDGYHLSTSVAKKNGSQALIDEKLLPKFNDARDIHFLERDREPEIYQGPLVIIPENSRGTPMCYLGRKPLIYSQSYLGISTKGYRDPELLAVFLTIVLRSNVRRYIGLLTTSRYGVNRNTLPIETTEQMPIPLFDDLSSRDKEYCNKVLERWKKGKPDTPAQREDMFHWVCSLYKISKEDQQVIKDTLATLCPSKRGVAQKIPTLKNVKAYCSTIQSYLDDVFRFYGVEDQSPKVTCSSVQVAGWRFFEVGNCELAHDQQKIVAEIIRKLADDEGLSQCVVPLNDKIIVGRLDQFRYWTSTRAKLMAHEILSLLEQDRKKWGLPQ